MCFFIRGNKERGSEVIKILEDKGGNNIGRCKGNIETAIYYTNKRNEIHIASTLDNQMLIMQFCEELTLHEKWVPEFKIGEVVDYINKEGVITNTGKVVNYLYDAKHYIVESEGEEFYWAEKFVSLHKEYDLKNIVNKKWSPTRGERVLVRNYDNSVWEEAVFSFKRIYLPTDQIEYHTIGGNKWSYCIPFNINKIGKISE